MAPAIWRLRVLWYYPLEHRWAFEVRPTSIAMDWYGRTLLAALAAFAAFILGHTIAARMERLSARGYALWAAWMTSTLLLAMALYAYQLAFRHALPEVLPPGYVPR